jgi:hypothetical protein
VTGNLTPWQPGRSGGRVGLVLPGRDRHRGWTVSPVAASGLARVTGRALAGTVGFASDLVSPVLGALAALDVPLCERPPHVRVCAAGSGCWSP